MGLGDLVNKGKDAFEQNKDKLAEAAKSDQGRDALDKATDAAKKATPDAADSKIDDVRRNIDKTLGG
ncbi:hypothetical protein [Microbacterium amylolyticum]|uniref:MT0933-like antitoxin protein n=1 Tax=Microbacterium amylolyticum TaxID=936337 RepID=A0ABS4ZIJ1_9MICO|nr:hypothetical protein [Microbacterium amylolyticum]MBP2437082.1 hypothetical protein [Microbacterium amylolyticum]